MTKRLRYALYACMISLVLPWTMRAQDFQRNYSIGAGGHIKIGNVSGDVKVTGYSGDSISVAGFTEGPDRSMIRIEDTSSPDSLELRVRYPGRGNCNASVRFEIRVPKSIDYSFDRVSSVSGDVEINDVTGRIRANSVSGNVDVRNVTGVVSANSVSGNVSAEIEKLQDSGEMKLSTVSGNVDVKAPADLDASVEMSTLSGSLATDFPIEIVERRYGPGRSAHGRLGSGLYSLRLTTISGHVNLYRR